MPFGKIFTKKEQKFQAEKEKKQQEAVPQGKKPKASAFAVNVLRNPHITEKAVQMAEQNHYVFQVAPTATKHQVKRAVEDLYDVEVAGIRIVAAPPKPTRWQRKRGTKSGYKKAIVTLEKGQKIEILPT
ncbi:MAG: 50S ribosomal protein L23 [Candidatus Wildermuthbacteria bacterium]|nr:50S ribosomal protein L23 [Candidatus Wildermuthbacteria bacterium]